MTYNFIVTEGEYFWKKAFQLDQESNFPNFRPRRQWGRFRPPVRPDLTLPLNRSDLLLLNYLPHI